MRDVLFAAVSNLYIQMKNAALAVIGRAQKSLKGGAIKY